MSTVASIVDFLSYLRTLDIKLWIEDHQLHYSVPKNALTPALRAELIRRKAEIIAFLQSAQAAMVATPPLQPVQRGNVAPLSFAQERLWLLDQMLPDSTAYLMPGVVRLIGPLDTAVFTRSLNAIIERHEVLRTTFVVIGGEARQQISAHRPITVPVIDLQPLPEPERAAEILRRATDETRQPFDLAHGPLLRATLLRLAPDAHVLLLTLHHIIADGWSLGVLLREVAALYAAHGDPAALPALPFQYADYTLWQRAWLQGTVLEQQLGYWRAQLGGIVPLALPTDYPRPALQSFNGAQHRFTLSPSLTAALHDLSQREGVTLFMTLLTAWQVLLARYSGTWDVAVGTPIANRTQANLEPLIGFFVNTLVLRTDLRGNPGFLDALGRVRAVALAAYAHQDAPFEQVVEALQPERSLGHSPLVTVLFALQNAPLPGLELGAVRGELLDGVQTTAKFDVSLLVTERADGLEAVLEYATDLFAEPTIARLGAHWTTALAAIVAQPDLPIAAIPILPLAEAHRLLHEWNATSRSYPHDRCVHELVATQAARTPEAVALVYGTERVTYAELDRRANQLAHHLQSLGVGLEVLVGIYLDRSVNLVIAMLAVLKAGGCYVPLDPTYPQERIAFMLEDTQTPVVLTEDRLRERLHLEGAASTTRVLCLDIDWWRIAQEPETVPSSAVASECLAYVMYTSGSTGQPKGTAITHRAIVRLVCNTDYVQLTSADRIAQASNTAFDAATFEIWGALITGAQLIGIAKEIALSPEPFAALVQEQAITTIFMTTAWFNQVASLVPQAFRSLRQVLFGGEACDPQRVRAVLRQHAPQRLLHVYGPTESTTFASWYEVRDVPTGATTIPIGYPIANTTIYLLDPQMQPVPIGVPGEVHIGGDGLMRGYFRRPELTAERLVPHPFNTEPGARLYKTGDLARYRADGAIEFLGRIDQQVKLRGFRIELGEIESVLLEHQAVSDAVVLLRDDRLVGYVVARPDEPISLGDVRDLLQRRLPDYMIPAALVVLDRLPLTPNGKVDRHALPAPDYPLLTTDSFVAPRTETETTIARIWQEVLGVEQVGVHDNFFALGGHSLLATQVMTRLRDTCRVELPLRTLFESPTVAGIAAHLSRAAEEPLPRPPLLPRPATAASNLPLSFAQQRLWFLHQLDPDSAVYHVPITVRLFGSLQGEAFQRSLHAIIQRHEALRTSFPLRDQQPVQAIVPDVGIALPLIDLSRLPEAQQASEIARLTREEMQRPFDLTVAPLLRATLLRLAPDAHVLLLTLHHIITDGWSMGVLLRELATLYAAHGDPAALPALPIQYADYTLWQRNWMQGAVLEQLLDFWRQELAGVSESLALPTDYPRPPVQSFRGAQHRFTLSPSLTAALQDLSQREGVTLFMTLLTAWQVLLARYSGSWDLTVGTPIANRREANLEPLIGFFVNTIVLRTDLRGNPSFLDALARVRRATLAAYAHQDLPFEQLVEAIHPSRSLSSSPLFQVMLALQNAPLPELRLGDLTLRVDETAQPSAKFDLSLLLTESDAGIDAVLEYATDLFAAPTIERMVGHFQVLLEGILADPNRRIAEIPLLPDAERDLVLTLWNQTQTSYPRTARIHDLVAAQAERTPDHTALVAGSSAHSYAELNERANQLAHYLQSIGVGPEIRVGVYLDRSPELIVALLAVLKAGGAYVPLDPAYPAERIQFMLEDSQALVILTRQKQRERLASARTRQAAQIVCLDDVWAQIGQGSRENPASGTQPANLAYLIYTSGSTGRPKGVAIAHQSAVALIQWALATYDRSDLACVAAGTSVCFDLSIFEIFVPLSCGGTIRLIDDALQIPALADEPITLLNTVPSVLTEVLRSGSLPSSVRAINLAGEPLPRSLVDALAQTAPAARIYNLYGPSEDTTYSTFTQVGPDETRPPPIGRPIANTEAYVLDGRMQPVPIGVAGELYLGGDGLARGYLNRPDQTAQRFVPDPFSGRAGARLYQTGDLARYRADGAIEFLGRIDQQVKLRGFRIEPGEIEAALRQHEAVQDAVAVVQDERLVAYVVQAGPHPPAPSPPNAGEGDSSSRSPSPAGVPSGPGEGEARSAGVRAVSTTGSESLRSFLSSRLPAYMVPSLFVPLDALPLTPSGKVDRKALPALAADRPDLAAAFVAPRTETEATIARIWQEVLGVEQVGVHDNFFDRGGHSLLATQIMSRIRTTFQVNPALRTLFEQPTIAHLARIIEQETRQPAPAPRSKIQALPRRGTQSRQLAEKLDQLSEQEIQQLLRERKTAQTGESSHD